LSRAAKGKDCPAIMHQRTGDSVTRQSLESQTCDWQN
jgi:hypothetical protein